MRRFLASALCAPLLLTLAACASQPDRPMDQARARALLEVALEHIEEIYYRETEASALVAAGLEGITETYPEIRFAHEGDKIIASVSDEAVYNFKLGADHGSAEFWGDRLAVTLDRVAAAVPGGEPKLNGLTDSFLKGVVGHLDELSRYGTPEEGKEARRRHYNQPGSLNIDLKESDSGWQVDCVRDAFLRDTGSLLPGDLITHAGGKPTAGLSRNALVDLIDGPVGTIVELSVVRGNEEARTISLWRKLRGIDSVGLFGSEDSTRIVIASFEQGTPDRLQNELRQPAATPASKGMILDLRGNRGGLLDSVISTTDHFLTQGEIISTYGRHRDSVQRFLAKSDSSDFRAPLVVLTDEETASGAEIMVAALQDNFRAIVIGQATFGLGTIRTALPLPNDGLLLLTWVEISTPAGYRLDKRGVMPTVCTGGDVTADQMLAALRSGAGIIDKATRTRDIDPDDTAAVEAFRALCPPRGDDANVSLEVAQALLADPVLFAKVLDSGDAQKTAAR